jgi:hypothetical protein
VALVSSRSITGKASDGCRFLLFSIMQKGELQGVTSYLMKNLCQLVHLALGNGFLVFLIESSANKERGINKVEVFFF